MKFINLKKISKINSISSEGLLEYEINGFLKRHINMPCLFDQFYFTITVDEFEPLKFINKYMLEKVYLKYDCHSHINEDYTIDLVISLSDMIGFVDSCIPPHIRDRIHEESTSINLLCDKVNEILSSAGDNVMSKAISPIEFLEEYILKFSEYSKELYENFIDMDHREYIMKCMNRLVDINTDNDVIAYVLGSSFDILHHNDTPEHNISDIMFICTDNGLKELISLFNDTSQTNDTIKIDVNVIGEQTINNKSYHVIICTVYDICNNYDLSSLLLKMITKSYKSII